MQTIQASNVRQILPPITKADFTGFETEEMNRRVSNWGWAHLIREICPLLRSNFIRNNAGEWTDFGITGDARYNIPDLRNNDMFGRYGLLNGMVDGDATHTWTNMDGTTIVHGKRPEHPPVDPHFIWIPHVWAVNAIAAASEGIVRISTFKPHRYTLRNYHIVGHKVNGDIAEVLSNGSGGFKYVSPSKWFLGLLEDIE
jgi:hypothetical protein